ncbi:MAG TPA: ABC transporter substrate-binding protein [Methanospirillum sp.]|uniref:ABC transporter substrate-binding protein n=1 Tax=Methanospirillum sp. TaxID=45200 RepID=UPI002D1CCB5F|nr:ABC transporter substrate-binding protein [Methanospirillum sp.]HWQ64021.1 ABC transporter substrate-binding protein [Methanospirillum sp.]
MIFGISGTAFAEDGKILNIALGTEPTDLNAVANNAMMYDIIKVFSGLIKSDNNLAATGDLAKTWEQPDPNTYVFHLRDGVKWHDGTDFSSDDVKFTYDLLRSKEWITIFPLSSQYTAITNIETPDKNTVKFTVKDPVVPFIEKFSLPILPKHLLEGQDLTKTEFWQKPVGTGPYVFDHWNKGEELVFKANKNYYNGVPKIETLRYVIVPDESGRINLLKSGEVQVIKMGPKSMDSVKSVPGVKVLSTPSSNWYSLDLPYILPQFKDKAVHQAIGLAINKKAILDSIYVGQGQMAYGPYRSESPVYNPDIVTTQDTEKAKKILTDAGWKIGSDGVMEKDGVKLEFDLLYVATATERKDIAIAVVPDLEKIGIKVNPVALANWNEMTAEKWHNNAAVMAQGSPLDPDNNVYMIYHSKFINDGTNNLASYNSPEADKLIDQGRTTSDTNQRKQIYQQLQKVLAEDQPCVPILYGNDIYALSDKVSGMVPRNGPHGGSGIEGSICGNLWWNVETWDLKE